MKSIIIIIFFNTKLLVPLELIIGYIYNLFISINEPLHNTLLNSDEFTPHTPSHHFGISDSRAPHALANWKISGALWHYTPFHSVLRRLSPSLSSTQDIRVNYYMYPVHSWKIAERSAQYLSGLNSSMSDITVDIHSAEWPSPAMPTSYTPPSPCARLCLWKNYSATRARDLWILRKFEETLLLLLQSFGLLPVRRVCSYTGVARYVIRNVREYCVPGGIVAYEGELLNRWFEFRSIWLLSCFKQLLLYENYLNWCIKEHNLHSYSTCRYITGRFIIIFLNFTWV